VHGEIDEVVLKLCNTPKFVFKVTTPLPNVRMLQNPISFPQTIRLRKKESVVMPAKLRFLTRANQWICTTPITPESELEISDVTDDTCGSSEVWPIWKTGPVWKY